MTTPRGGESPAMPNIPSSGLRRPSAQPAAQNTAGLSQQLKEFLGLTQKIEHSTANIGRNLAGAARSTSNGGVGTGSSRAMNLNPSFGGAPSGHGASGGGAGGGGPRIAGHRGGQTPGGPIGSQTGLPVPGTQVAVGVGAILGTAVAGFAARQATGWTAQAVSSDIAGNYLGMTGRGQYHSGTKWGSIQSANRAFAGGFLSTGERDQAMMMGWQSGLTRSQIMNVGQSVSDISSAMPGLGADRAMQAQAGLLAPRTTNRLRLLGISSRERHGDPLSNPRAAAAVGSDVFDTLHRLGGSQRLTGADVQSMFREGGNARSAYQAMGFSEEMIQYQQRVQAARVGPGGRMLASNDPRVRDRLDDTAYKPAADRAAASGQIQANTTEDFVRGLNAANDSIAKFTRELTGLATAMGNLVGTGAGFGAGIGTPLPGMGPGSIAADALGTASNTAQQLGGLALGGYALKNFALPLLTRGRSKAGGGRMGYGGAAMTGAGIGATVGSIIPGVGTAIGAGVGAVAGLAGRALFNSGGLVPGEGNTDSVNARLTPGEVVVPRHVVDRHGGAENLIGKLGFGGRRGGRHFREGGEVWGDPDDPNFARENIVTVNAGGMSVQVHKRIAGSIQGFLDELVSAGYKPKSVGGHANRNIAGTKKKSNHAWGAAIDIDPFNLGNGFDRGTKSKIGSGFKGDAWVTQLARKYGLGWGGEWKGRKDWMHFEAIGSPSAAKYGGAAGALVGTSAGESTESGGVGVAEGYRMGKAPGIEGLTGFGKPTVDIHRLGERTSGGTGGTAPAAPIGKGGDYVSMGQQMAARRGWTGAQWDALYQMWQRESNWNPKAANPTSSARGIPQAMMSAHFGKDWQNNPEAQSFLNNPAEQINWGLDYIKGRYGDPAKAWAFWQRNKHYSEGAWRTKDETANLHEGEMVLPAKVADAVRGAITDTGGMKGGGGNRVVIHAHFNGASERDAKRLVGMVKRALEEDDYEMAGAS